MVANAEDVHRHYLVYGQRLCSNLPLPELPHASFQSRDVAFRCLPPESSPLAAVPPPRLLTRKRTNLDCYIAVYETGEGFLLRWEGLCDFLVSADGRQVLCQPVTGLTLEWVQSTLYGVVLSFALHLRGVGNLHGSAVALPGGAVGFLAQSGGGKSTLAAALNHAGYPFLTDDVLALKEQGETLAVLPGFPFVSLSNKAAHHLWGCELLAVSRQPSAGDPQGLEKRRTYVNGHRDAFCRTPVPLEGLYLLERREGLQKVDISPLPTRQAILGLLEETSTLPLLPRDALARHFAFVTGLVSRIPVWRLSYPSGMEHMTGVCQAILSHQGEK